MDTDSSKTSQSSDDDCVTVKRQVGKDKKGKYPKLSRSAQAVWDFTINNPDINWLEDIKKTLKARCKKWVFQYEKVDKTCTFHYQGRVSLKTRSFNPNFFRGYGVHWSPTNTMMMDNFDYSKKEESRVDGPWKWTDEQLIIPKQVKEIVELYPFQKQIIQQTRKLAFSS